MLIISRLLITLLLISTTVQATASVIVSRCRIRQTDLSLGSLIPEELPPPIFDPNQFTPSSEFLNSGYLRWMAHMIHKLTGWSTEYSEKDSSHIARILDDLRLYVMQARRSHDCVSAPEAIFPYVAQIPAGAKRDDLKVNYKICQFYQDDQRQISIEGTCRNLSGRAGGYKLTELDARFAQFNETVHIAQGLIDTGVIAASLFASGRVLKILRTSARFATMGTLSRTLVASVPTATGAALTLSGYSDLPIQNMVDVRDSAKLSVNGHLVDAVYVSMPIEKFETVLAGYLATIPEDSIVPNAPSKPVAKGLAEITAP